MYFVYILRSLESGKTYVGRTELLPETRLRQHNLGSNEWTSHNGPFELIYYERFHCKQDSMERETFLKSGVGNKLVALVRENY
jgi:predicted GIY-YIG superfamily endonuclease